jgi:hypothetical protein
MDAVKTLRIYFAAALALYLVWVGAPLAMAVLSSSRPAASGSRDLGVPAVSAWSETWRTAPHCSGASPHVHRAARNLAR